MRPHHGRLIPTELNEATEPQQPEPPDGGRAFERATYYQDLVAEGRAGETVDTSSESATVDAPWERVPEIPPLLRGREPLQVKEMEPEYIKFDQDNGVEMLDDIARERRRVFSGSDGKLYGVGGQPLDTSGANSAHHGRGYAIFVMDNQGNLYVSSRHDVGAFHHSSLLSGEPVAGAGEIKVRAGTVEAITNTSGHYKPGPQYRVQVIAELERQQVDMSAVTKR